MMDASYSEMKHEISEIWIFANNRKLELALATFFSRGTNLQLCIQMSESPSPLRTQLR